MGQRWDVKEYYGSEERGWYYIDSNPGAFATQDRFGLVFETNY